MKKQAALLVLLIALLLFTACSKETPSATDVAALNQEVGDAAPIEEMTVSQTKPLEPDENYYVGTWKATSIEQDGLTATIEALERIGNYNLSGFSIILQEDGNAHFYYQDGTAEGKWYITPSGINMGNNEMILANDMLSWQNGNKETIYFSKTSDSQMIEENPKTDTDQSIQPLPESNDNHNEKLMGRVINVSEDVNVRSEPSKDADVLGKAKLSDSYEVLTEYASDEWHKISFQGQDGYINADYFEVLHETGAQRASYEQEPVAGAKETDTQRNGIRKEFKDTMDSYEVFFDEYCAFMDNYSKSSNVLNMLEDYSRFMTKYTDAMRKLEAIGNENLSNEELKYYTEVMGRINQKLLNVIT